MTDPEHVRHVHRVRATNTEPFTAAVCHGQACGHEHGQSVVNGLRGCIRRQRHGVLVSTGCPLGRLGCRALGRDARHPAGALLIVQPCTVDRQPAGLPLWIGPLSNEDDLAAVRRWLDTGHLDPRRLPTGLRFRTGWQETARRATTN